MVLAAGLLTWMIIWMRRQSAGMQKELEQGVANAAEGQENRWALFWPAFLAVGREGLETAVFSYNGNPALTELIAYGAYVIAAWLLWKNVSAAPKRKLVA